MAKRRQSSSEGDLGTFQIQFGDGAISEGPAIDFTPNQLHQDIAETLPISGKGKNKNAGIVHRLHGSNPRESYKHQKDAVKNLDKHLHDAKGQFRGIVVIPTGGGKTRVAVDWLMRKVLDEKRKILWIAHREELLVQAWNAFSEQAYTRVLPNREQFQIRRVAGSFDQPIRIEKSDDVVIASVQSLRGTALKKVQAWLKGSPRPFLVIDEAHHAPAPTYRQIISALCKDMNADLLGLTATPFRTIESEKGAIAKIFGERPIYSVGLSELIDDEILARPTFISPKTNFNFKDVIPDDVWEKVVKNQFNLDVLDDEWAKKIGKNAERNRAIVDHYCDNSKKYGKTLVFALNVPNAIALNERFRSRGIRSEYVLGDERDRTGRHNVSRDTRTQKLQQFKDGEIEVLINVNVFTEGTDLPKVQTVFLTRPTTSTTLVMQMVGRALRGKKAGGTKEAFIVSFIDEWEQKIEWASAGQLFYDANTDFQDKTPESKQRVTRLISIALLEKLAAVFDASLPENTYLQDYPFLERVPIGLFSFSLLDPHTGADRDRTILVYKANHAAFEEFRNGLPSLLKRQQSNENDSLSASELEEVRQQYFANADTFPKVSIIELQDLIQHTKVYGHVPEIVLFEERDQFDIDAVAKTLFDQGLGGQRKLDHLQKAWEQGSAGWQRFFGIEGFSQFLREVNYAMTRHETKLTAISQPNVRPEEIGFDKMKMHDLKEQRPDLYAELRKKVDATHRHADGTYECAGCGRKSKDRAKFEMDHQHPFGEGGPTNLKNLQLLCVKCNVTKGPKVQ